jgi:hypothetical protein
MKKKTDNINLNAEAIADLWIKLLFSHIEARKLEELKKVTNTNEVKLPKT